MMFENDTIDIGLSWDRPAMTLESMRCLRSFCPSHSPDTYPVFSLFPRNDRPLTFADEHNRPFLLSPEGVPVCSGTLLTLTYPDYLTVEGQRNLYLAQLSPLEWNGLDGRGESELRIYWSLAHYPAASQMRYRFVWGYRHRKGFPLCPVSDQVFAVNDLEPWFHVQLDMREHAARMVLGSPVSGSMV